MRCKALSFLLNDCLGLGIDFKAFRRGGRREVRPHNRFESTEIGKMLKSAKQHSAGIYALILMMTETGPRIQDLVGISFGDILDAKEDTDGFRIVRFAAKKTTSRDVYFSSKVFEAV
jgi:integrase